MPFSGACTSCFLLYSDFNHTIAIRGFEHFFTARITLAVFVVSTLLLSISFLALTYRGSQRYILVMRHRFL